MSSIDKLVMRQLKLSRNDTLQLLIQKSVFVNDYVVTNPKLPILRNDSVKVIENETRLLQSGQPLTYIVYNKPIGVECSLNPSVKASLSHIADWSGIYPVGRLDKRSEGLLLMTNDGRLYKAITTHNTIEKEYEVTVNSNISEDDLLRLASGIEIMGSVTLPAGVKRCGNNQFRIILKEGRNRQIRRMCYKLKLEVERLIRIRIHELWLGDLKPGEFRNATAEEIHLLQCLYSYKFIAE